MIGFSGASRLILFSALITIGFSLDRDANQLNVIGNLIVGIGSLMLVVAAIIAIDETQQQDKQASDDKRDLEKQLAELRQQIKELKNT